jgi:DNA invertase Pin-like site-specific DNA recombinase/flagellar biosynthesis chaperone FliJ
MEQYCIYLRKSRVDVAKGEEDTLTRHETILKELANVRGLRVSKVYKEIVSGDTISARPKMQELLHDVELGIWTGVLVMEVERLARGDTIDQGIVAQTFKYSDTLIITPTKTYDPNNEFDEEYFEFGLFMSRREYKTINRRLQAGRLASIKEGNYIGSHRPYGYDKIKVGKHYTLTPNPDESSTVQLIYEWYTKGILTEDGTYTRIGTTLIAKRLNALSIKPQKNATWSASSVRDILINPIYIGKVRWNWRPTKKSVVDGKVAVTRPRSEEVILVDGLHPPIVSLETFNLAQHYISQNPPSPVKQNSTLKNPLSGLVVCSVCGHTMVRKPSKKYPDMLMCTHIGCTNVSSKLEYVEKKVLLALADWIREYRVQGNSNTSIAFSQSELTAYDKAIQQLDEELTTLNQQLSNAYDLLEREVYTPQVFALRTQSITTRITERTTKRAKLLEDRAKLNDSIISSQQLIPQVEYVLSVYSTLSSPQERNDLLNTVIEKVLYDKPKGGRWGDPEDFTIQVFPKLPKV